MNKKGFTLIELLAVIIILGILMIIAIPSVTKYISDSRKSSYIDTAKELVSGARNLVNDGKLEMYDTDATYYIDIACIKTENGGKAVSPYGDFVKEKAYVVVTFDGKGYDYYWTSVDETGQGVKNLIKYDKLDSEIIESDLKADDIEIDRGIDGRSEVILITERNNCQKEGAISAESQINGETGEDYKPICIRATKLHTTLCERSDTNSVANGCYSEGYSIDGSKGTTTITYGNLGTKKQLNVGDAFDCDINGDGIYNQETERFYYLSNDGNIANLILYTNIRNGNVWDGSTGYAYANLSDLQVIDSSLTTYDNWHGPVTALKNLPSKDQWKNDKLIIPKNRNIVNELGTNTTKNGNYTIQSFSYDDKAARLLSVQDLNTSCGITVGAIDYNYGELKNCLFLFEKTTFEAGLRTHGFWLENPYSKDNQAAWYVDGTSRYVSKYNVYNTYGARPVIMVHIYDIEY